MHFPSLLAALSLQCLLFLAGFLYFGMQQRWTSGSRWWAMAAATSPTAVALLGYTHGYGTWIFALGAVLIQLDSWLHWTGMRAHMGCRPDPRNLAFVLTMALISIVFQMTQAPETGRMITVGLYLLSVSYTSTAIYFDARRYRRDTGRQEMLFLERVSIFEVILVVGLGVYLGLQPPTGPGIGWFHALLVMYMLAMTVRMSSYFLTYLSELQRISLKDREDLQTSRTELATLIENLGAGVVVLTPDQRISLINRAAQQFFKPMGLRGDAQRLPLDEWHLVNSEGLTVDADATPLLAAIQQREPIMDAVLGLSATAEGPVSWGLFNAFPSFDARGQLQHVVLTFVDITALKLSQAEQKLLQQKLAETSRIRSLGTLASGVAHDFNNILTAILGRLDLLSRAASGGATMDAAALQDNYQSMTAAARRGRELVRQILSFGRQRPTRSEPCDPVELVNESVHLLRANAPAHVELRVRNDTTAVWIKGDATQLIQVLVNLGTNAIHAMGARAGVIDLTIDTVPLNNSLVPASLAAEWRTVQPDVTCAVRLGVHDQGSGMSPQTMERIFEPFFTTKAVGRGTGLGLAVVHGIVESHHGRVEVSSQPDRGSRFTIWLAGAPAHSVAAAGGEVDVLTRGSIDAEAIVEDTTQGLTEGTTTVGPIASASDLSRPHATNTASSAHIVYLDDEPAVGDVVTALLQSHGHRCHFLSQPHNALDHLRQHHLQIDLLITDYRMPHMNGLEVAELALREQPGLPVVVLSGYIDEAMERGSQAIGVRALMLKADAIDDIGRVASLHRR